MKKTIISLLAITAVISLIYIYNNSSNELLSDIDLKRQQHEQFLASSPFKDTKNLSKDKRKQLKLPPNAHNERLWELTMNPTLGFPTPFLVESTTPSSYISSAAPGTSNDPWQERGPLNTGGRTRVAFFDPNDVGANNGDGVDYNRVFAGGVSGGLWVNDNITSAASSWNIVPGIAGDLSVNAFAIDPNNSNIIYIGTGEQSSFGTSIGNGVYKTTDGGATWNQVNIQPAGPGNLSNSSTLFQSGIFGVNDIVIRDVNGTSEIYIGVSSIFNTSSSNPNNLLGTFNGGIYRSVDDGTTWNRIENPSMALNFSGITYYVSPSDFEIGADNTLYMGSVAQTGLGQGGGRIYSSTDGTNWILEQVIANADRVEIATSSTNPNLIYAAVDAASGADLYVSTDKLTSITPINEPNDADNGISATDFTRGQAFYDLVIEVDPTNDQIIYAAGIDLFRSTNGGTTWSQISRWDFTNGLQNINTPFIHADIHTLIFNPLNTNQALIGSDGGISYAISLTAAVSNPNAIVTRNNGYNVTQFNYGDIADIDIADGDDLIGGTQDNGSLFVNDASANGLAIFLEGLGGDGAFSEIDKDGNYAILSFPFQSHFYVDYPLPNNGNILGYPIADNTVGDFVNIAELDDNLNVFFANGSTANNGILVCSLGATAASCNTITNALTTNSRPTAMKVSPFTTTSSKLFLGTANSRLIRVDNANTASPVWTEITGPQFLGSVSDIEFGDTEQEIMITMHNYGVDSVWYSTNGGTTWTNKEGNLPDIPVRAILKNPLLTEEVIIGTEEGIYVTGNFNSASPTWTQTNNGMTSVNVVDLDLRVSDNTILATTYGRGMFTGKFNTLGFEESQIAQNEIRLFPTINNGNFNLASDIELNDAQVSIYNLSGQEIYNSKINLSGQQANISLNNTTSGVYIVRITSGTYNESIKMIIE